MQLQSIPGGFALYKERTPIGRCLLCQRDGAFFIDELCIDPAWRRRGYGSYLLREVLRWSGGYRAGQASCHRAPLPADPTELAFWQRFGFVAGAAWLERSRWPDLSAVALAHEFLAPRLPAGGFAIDATCGNGHDTEFLCRTVGPGGHVLALDIQAAAVAATRQRLANAGLANAQVVQANHADLARLAPPASADAVLFNFGWLPGADHAVFSGESTSLPALTAALDLLKPGGVLSAVLYSGSVIGECEKQAVLAWLQALPLTACTVICSRFANWADTAPLPCFVLKK